MGEEREWRGRQMAQGDLLQRGQPMDLNHAMIHSMWKNGLSAGVAADMIAAHMPYAHDSHADGR